MEGGGGGEDIINFNFSNQRMSSANKKKNTRCSLNCGGYQASNPLCSEGKLLEQDPEDSHCMIGLKGQIGQDRTDG